MTALHISLLLLATMAHASGVRGAIEWIEHPDQVHVSPLFHFMHRSTVDDCKEWCITTANCAGFTWRLLGEQCWFAETSHYREEDLRPLPDFIFYEKIETTEIVSNEWVEHPDQVFASPLFNSMSHSTVDDCKEWCLAKFNCAGFSWRLWGEQCWFAETSHYRKEYLMPYQDFIFYEKTASTETVLNEWIEHPDQFFAYPVLDFMHPGTVDDCKEWCLTTYNCAGFSWKPLEEQCWFAETSNYRKEDLRPHQDFIFYEKVAPI